MNSLLKEGNSGTHTGQWGAGGLRLAPKPWRRQSIRNKSLLQKAENVNNVGARMLCVVVGGRRDGI